MAQPPHLVPRRFIFLTGLRLFASPFFLATTIKTGDLARKIHEDLRPSVRADLRLSDSGQMMLMGGLVIETMFCLWSFVWAWGNLLGEGMEQSRWTCLRWSYYHDLTVGAVSVLSITLQQLAVRHTICHANLSNQKSTSQVKHETQYWCSNFENNFRLTAAILVLLSIPVFFTSRFLYVKRLRQARGDADDWTKGHSDRSQPLLHLLQVMAAPFRFLYRFLCKVAHFSRNPFEWFALMILCFIPLLVFLSVAATGKTFKGIRWATVRTVKFIRRRTKSRGRPRAGKKPRASNADSVGATPVGVETLETPKMTALAEAHRDSFELRDLDSRPSRSGTKGSPLTRPSDESNKRQPWKRKRTETTKFATSGSSLLERVLDHPTLFFELTSQLHGADFRAVSRTSKVLRSITSYHLAERPHVINTYLCSRTPNATPNGRPLPSDYEDLGLDPSATTDNESMYSFDPNPQDPCWGCGIPICELCKSSKDNLRVSKHELRLRTLQPVCSTCYFKCLCEPTFVKDSEAGTASDNPGPPDAPCKIFPSMSQKCQCIAEHPTRTNTIPRGPRSLCRNCKGDHVHSLWKKRFKRGAVASQEELPVPLRSENYTNRVTDATLVPGASAASSGVTPTQPRENGEPELEAGYWAPGVTEPAGASALKIRKCHGCRKDLWWIMGRNTGLRWWRCRRCGLEARDTMMSAIREFFEAVNYGGLTMTDDSDDEGVAEAYSNDADTRSDFSISSLVYY